MGQVGRGRPQDKIRDGDWACLKCDNNNFAWRQECHRCGNPKPGDHRSLAQHIGGKRAANQAAGGGQEWAKSARMAEADAAGDDE